MFPLALKPLVLSLGFNIPLPQSIYNDLLCAFVDYFSLSPLKYFKYHFYNYMRLKKPVSRK